MSFELVSDKMVLDQKIGKETTQLLLEGDIIVPDVKPDMSLILQTDAKINFNNVEAAQDRVNFNGNLEITMLYLSKGSETPVHSIKTMLPIDDFINVDGATRDMWAEIQSEFTNIDYKVLNDRKVSYRVVADVTTDVSAVFEHPYVSEIKELPEEQSLKSTIEMSRIVEAKKDKFVIKDELSIPQGKPNIREVLQSYGTITNKEVKTSNGKINISGELLISTIYISDVDDSLIEHVENEIPFNGVIELKNAKEDMICDCNIGIKSQAVQVRPDADGEERVLDVEVEVAVSAKVRSEEKMQLMEDAHCINKNIKLKKNLIEYPKFVCRNKNQSNIKEIVQLNSNCPEILQIFRVDGKPHIDNLKILEDKVVAEGIITTDVLYIAKNDETPLYGYQTIIPFKQVIETKGASDGMDVDVHTAVEHIGFNMLSGNEVEVRFLLSFNTNVMEYKYFNLITDLEIEDLEKGVVDKMSSMTIYICEPGDTLWKIAKRYNTTIDEIATLNEIENISRLNSGQKLLILKKVA